MDTHFAPSPALDQEADALHARLPGELENDSPIPGPVSEQEALAAGGRLPSSESRRPWGRRKGLLAGAAIAAVLVVGGGAYLSSSYNHIYPMPRLASTVRNTAAQVGVKLPPVLAPSASLAKVNVPPQSPATHDSYAPKTRDQEVAELLSLHTGAGSGPAPTPAAGPGPRASGGSHSDSVAPSDKPALRVAGNDIPTGYVASEPGSTLPAVGLARLDPARPKPPASAHSVQQDPPASVTSGEPQTIQSQPPSSSTVTPPTPVQVSATPPGSTNPVAPIQPADPIAVAQTLRPGPMSSADQVQVLGLVTEMASMVKDLKKQNAQLRVDFGKSTADTSAHLRDYERRLALAEAKNAVSAANDVGSEQFMPQTVAEPSSPVRPTSISLTRAIAVVPAPAGSTAVKLYRVQAASPGLALLAQVDRGGGEGAQIQVAVGDSVPDYGRVKSISQKGTAWVVTTEHGPIQ
jgi:hypothetical protein